MSYTKRERGQYIKLKIHDSILFDLAHGIINAEKAGHVYNLISHVETAGTTHNEELAKNKYYQEAVAEWVKARKIQRQRFMESKSL